MKYFVIGFNKTATTSMHELFLLNGLSSQHDNNWDLDNYDCFSDCFPYNRFKEYNLTVKYPDAKFILNIRNMKDWIISVVNHCIIYKIQKEELNRKNTEWIWSWFYPVSRTKILYKIRERNNHIKEVLEYFTQMPNNLIILDVDNSNWVEFLCDQLNLNNKIHINAHTTKRLFNSIKHDINKEACKNKIDEARILVDSSFEAVKEDPEYKCIIYESNELDELIKLYANNLLK
jgi:hypothetical protein